MMTTPPPPAAAADDDDDAQEGLRAAMPAVAETEAPVAEEPQPAMDIDSEAAVAQPDPWNGLSAHASVPQEPQPAVPENPQPAVPEDPQPEPEDTVAAGSADPVEAGCAADWGVSEDVFKAMLDLRREPWSPELRCTSTCVPCGHVFCSRPQLVFRAVMCSVLVFCSPCDASFCSRCVPPSTSEVRRSATR